MNVHLDQPVLRSLGQRVLYGQRVFELKRGGHARRQRADQRGDCRVTPMGMLRQLGAELGQIAHRVQASPLGHTRGGQHRIVAEHGGDQTRLRAQRREDIARAMFDRHERDPNG